MKTSLRRALPVVAGLVIAATQQAHACPLCMGGADSNTGPALNGAIFLMLGFLGLMFSAIGAIAYSIWRRRHLAPPVDYPVGQH